MKSADLPERILAAIAKATSQHPARAEAVQSRTGADEAAFAAAIEQLAAGRRLNCAWIQKAGDAAPWLTIWPTGLPARSAAWSSGSHSALFVTHRPHALYQAHAPRSTSPAAPEPETPTMETPRKKGQLQADFTQLLTGCDHAVTLAAAAKKLGCSVESLRHAARALVRKGEVQTVDLAGVTAYMLAAPAERTDTLATGLDAIAEAPRPMAPEPEPIPQPRYRADDLRVTEIHDETPARIEFALWDDGRLSICDGDEIVLIPSDAVCRLALLLGVPGTTLPARPSMPPLPRLDGVRAEARA